MTDNHNGLLIARSHALDAGEEKVMRQRWAMFALAVAGTVMALASANGSEFALPSETRTAGKARQYSEV